MKKDIYIMLLALAAATMNMTSCSEDNDPFITAGEDDFPRILNTDLPEMTGGKPANLPTITRDVPFEFTAIVTPTQYTTVTWYADGELVSTGTTISEYFLAGDYDIKIVATTTKGKETYRNCTLKVLPCEGDPALADDVKSRWLKIGSTVTISGDNLVGVTAAYINGTALANFVNNGNGVSFTVPEMEEGDYKIVLETADMKYGCGNVTVSKDDYVDPGMTYLWQGSVDINWGDSNVALDCAELGITVGMTLVIGYELCDMPDNYHAARLATGPSWAADVLPQFDLDAGVPNGEFSVTITQEIMDAINGDGGQILIVGYGYTAKYVAVGGGSAGNVVWKGDVQINWGDSNVALNCAELGIGVGNTVTVEYELCDMPEGYHAARLATGPSWAADVLPQFDLDAGVPGGEFSVTITQEIMDAINGDGGQILIVGYGYTAKRVTVK